MSPGDVQKRTKINHEEIKNRGLRIASSSDATLDLLSSILDPRG
jgi:hypothetical protein